LGLPFAQRIVRRAASLILAPFVPVPFVSVPDWGGALPEQARL
jgi:hypothetical protein